MADLTNAISKVGVKTFGDFWGHASTTYGTPPIPAQTIFNRWYNNDNSKGTGVKTFGSFQGNASLSGPSSVGVKSFGTFPVNQVFPSGKSSVGVVESVKTKPSP